MTTVVFSPNLVGDTVMATPAIRALRQSDPSGRLVAVIKPHVAPTLAGNPWFDDMILFDHKSKNREYRTISAWRRLRRERADLGILFPNSFRSGVLAAAAGISRRVGFDRGERGFLLTDRLKMARNSSGDRIPVPAVEFYLALVRHLGIKVDSVRPELFTTPEDEAAADRVWQKFDLSRGTPVVCFNTGGAFGPAKSWPNAHFTRLAIRLVDELGVKVLVVCGPSERDAARAIVACAGRSRVVSLADGELSIGLTKACVRRSSLMVTTDSGPRHFAAAFGTPVISLFGPTHIAWTRTNHPRAIHLFHPVPCGPCQKPVCPEGHHKCMTELTPDSVFRAAERLLGRRSAVA